MITIKINNCNNEYKYGQYFNLFYNDEKRPYTPIVSNKLNNIFKFLIKKYDIKSVSKLICNNYIKDSVIYSKGPFGNNYYDNINDIIIINNKSIENTNIMIFSCGTGITPFYSIIDNLIINTKYNIILNASFRSKDDILLIDKLIDKKINKLTINLYLSNENNKLNENKIIYLLNKYNNYTILICGTDNYQIMIKNICNKYNIENYIY